MADERLERNWKMANAASENVMRPPNSAYRKNYDAIFRAKPKKGPKKGPK